MWSESSDEVQIGQQCLATLLSEARSIVRGRASAALAAMAASQGCVVLRQN